MPPLYLCIHLRDFAALALTAFAQNQRAPHICQKQANAGHPSGKCGSGEPAPIAVLSGEPPLERVFALSSTARKLGVGCGMSRLQAESFETILLRRDPRQEELAFQALVRCAERFSPRIEILASPQAESCGATLLLDVSGSERLLGSPAQIAAIVHRAVCEVVYRAPHICQLRVNRGHQREIEGAPPSFGRCGICDTVSVAIAHNACTALLAARGLPGARAIPAGQDSEMLAALPIAVLEPDAEQSQTLGAWGIRSLGQFAALNARAVAARLGQSGLRLHRQARGEYEHFLVPEQQPPDAPLCANMELEHPVELLEPLLFLLNQLLEQVMSRAAERALAIASVEVTLVLDKSRFEGAPFKPSVGLSGVVDVASAPKNSGQLGIEDVRAIRPALPERERLALLKLVQLELEMRPPASAVKAVRIIAYPAPPQSAQHGLFAAQAPEPGRLQVLLARLRKLSADGCGAPDLPASGGLSTGRVGSPALLDSRAPEAFRMTSFAPDHARVPHICPASANVGAPASASHPPALRVLRPPREVDVELRNGAPAVLRDRGRKRIVQASSGPWRSNGAWWVHPGWCREEWEICIEEHISTDAGIPCCLRLAHDPASKAWYVVGIYD